MLVTVLGVLFLLGAYSHCLNTILLILHPSFWAKQKARGPKGKHKRDSGWLSLLRARCAQNDDIHKFTTGEVLFLKAGSAVLGCA